MGILLQYYSASCNSGSLYQTSYFLFEIELTTANTWFSLAITSMTTLDNRSLPKVTDTTPTVAASAEFPI